MLVALQMANGEEFTSAVADLWLRGDAVLPLDPGLPTAETEKLLAEFRPHELITPGGREPLPDPLPLDRDVAAVILTSGSTGRPKGVDLSIGALRAAAVASHLRLEVEAGDRWLCCLPLHHIAGFGILVRSSLLDASPEIHDRPDAAILQRTEATLVSLVPTQLKRLLDEDAELSRFKKILVGGAAIDPKLVERAEAAGASVVRSYGMTETCGGVVYDGEPLDGVDVTLEPDGRIAIKGPSLMLRYRNDPELTDRVMRDGWFITTDRGRWNQGRLEVVGRVDEVIMTGGEKVAPAEVEAALRDHPLVDEAAVLGVPSEEWGEEVVAVVVPSDVGNLPELDEVRDFLRGRLSGYKLPRDIVLTAALPRLASGKVDVPGLRTLLGS
ncbi:MAG: class I adenylate-forming enzyme family protein [Actinomycetota bacterium]